MPVFATLGLHRLELRELIRGEHAAQGLRQFLVMPFESGVHFFRRGPLSGSFKLLALGFGLRALLLEDLLHFRFLRVVEAESLREHLDARTAAMARRSGRRMLGERKLCRAQHNQLCESRTLHDESPDQRWCIRRAQEGTRRYRATLGCARCGRCQEMYGANATFTVLDVNRRNRGTLTAP